MKPPIDIGDILDQAITGSRGPIEYRAAALRLVAEKAGVGFHTVETATGVTVSLNGKLQHQATADSGFEPFEVKGSGATYEAGLAHLSRQVFSPFTQHPRARVRVTPSAPGSLPIDITPSHGQGSEVGRQMLARLQRLCGPAAPAYV